MATSIYQKRLARARTAMQEWGLDTLILTPGPAMKYLTGYSEEGYERLLCLIVPDDRPLCFITPSLNAEACLANPAEIADVRQWGDSEGWEKILREVITELDLNIGIVGIDEGMPARFLLKIMELTPTALLKSAGPVFVALRSVKEEAELAALQRAAEITDRAYLVGAAACKPGVTEKEVAIEIERAIYDNGAELSFKPIVGSGPNSALPHHYPGNRKLQEGDVVLLDLGAKWDGYCGDITRVISLGTPSDDAKNIYEIVRNAYQRGVNAVKPGQPASFVDHVTRQVIGEAGFGDFFIHRTGHGIGMEDHEAPNIVSGNDTKLEPGMCFSVEPGIYLPGKFGVRLENIMTVTPDGGRVFNADIPDRLMDVAEIVQ